MKRALWNVASSCLLLRLASCTWHGGSDTEAQSEAGALSALPPKGYVRIRGGSFDGHVVGTFDMMTTEVTVADYRVCVEAGACVDPEYACDGYQWACNYDKRDRENHPMNGVSHAQAQAFCDWVKARLPTEWEWEWAARGRDEGRTFPWGEAEPAPQLLNACGAECKNEIEKRAGWEPRGMYEASDGYAATAPVGTKRRGASRDGLLDMAGNVWEWTSTADSDGIAGVRGGGWLNHRPPETVRADFRYGFNASVGDSTVGFRCAMTP